MSAGVLSDVDVAVRSIHLMAAGTPEQFAQVTHPDAFNRESSAEPPATRERGPAAFYATAVWLRAAFSDLEFTIDEVVTQGDLVVVNCWMSGRSTGEFEVWNADGGIDTVFPPTGRTFRVQQAHFLRMRDGLVIEHWAVRDDQSTALQIGWVPPTPLMIIRMILATARAKRRVARSGS
jgi:predicted ester cyclase